MVCADRLTFCADHFASSADREAIWPDGSLLCRDHAPLCADRIVIAPEPTAPQILRRSRSSAQRGDTFPWYSHGFLGSWVFPRALFPGELASYDARCLARVPAGEATASAVVICVYM